MRRQLAEVMYRLHISQIDSFMPDLPGSGESKFPQSDVTMDMLTCAVVKAIEHVSATHILSVRGGALFMPSDMPGWRYAPLSGERMLRVMLRARAIAERERGREVAMNALIEEGRTKGITLSGWRLSAPFFSALMDAELPVPAAPVADIAQHEVGGIGPWSRAEPDEDPEQADALAALIAIRLSEQ